MANMDDILDAPFICHLHHILSFFKALPCLQIAQIPRQGCLSVFAWSIRNKAKSIKLLHTARYWQLRLCQRSPFAVGLLWDLITSAHRLGHCRAVRLPCCHIATVPRCQAAIPIQLTRRRRRPVNAVQRWKVAAISNVPNHGQIAWLSTKKIFSQKWK